MTEQIYKQPEITEEELEPDKDISEPEEPVAFRPPVSAYVDTHVDKKTVIETNMGKLALSLAKKAKEEKVDEVKPKTLESVVYQQTAHSYIPSKEDEFVEDEPLEEPEIDEHSFVLLEKLGSGGFGEVWKAELPTGQFVAVKYLKQGNESVGLELEHPNITKTLWAGEDKQGKFVVREYVEGKSLREILNTRPEGVSYDEFLHVARPVVKALEYLHEKGIVHGDIKPENILVPDNPEEDVKLTDFGLSNNMTIDSLSASLRSKEMCGTLRYIAPESLRTGEKATKESDMYSLGLMLLEMLRGKIPRYKGDDATCRTETYKMFESTGFCLRTKEISLDYSFYTLWNCLEENPNKRPTATKLLSNIIDSLLEKEWRDIGNTVWNEISQHVHQIKERKQKEAAEKIAKEAADTEDKTLEFITTAQKSIPVKAHQTEENFDRSLDAEVERLHCAQVNSPLDTIHAGFSCVPGYFLIKGILSGSKELFLTAGAAELLTSPLMVPINSLLSNKSPIAALGGFGLCAIYGILRWCLDDCLTKKQIRKELEKKKQEKEEEHKISYN